jgi:molybdopterin synthase catalytic subunit
MSVSVRIVSGPIEELAPASISGDSGASLTFRGIVRPSEEGKALSGLRYEAYRPMAENTLWELCEAALRQFELRSIDLTHSEGFVPVAAASLVIHMESAHRTESPQAMTWLINALKRDVPIWKHPVYA